MSALSRQTAPTWRLFVAVPVPDRARARIDRGLAPYRATLPPARWLEPSTWHVTLVFVGSVAVRAVDDLARVCDAVAAAHAPFELEIVGGGGRIEHDEGVAWLAVARNAGRVIGLADALRQAMPQGVARGRDTRRTTSAHLTVARRVGRMHVDALRREALGPVRATWRVDRISLMRSHLTRTGARYEVVHDARLGADAEA